MRVASQSARLVRLEKGAVMPMDRVEQAFIATAITFSGDDGGDRLDDGGLRAGKAADLRIALPYAAVLLCLAVTAWLAFAHLF